MGMLTWKPEVFCDIACHDEVIQAEEICMMMLHLNYIYRRWFDDFR